MPTQNRNTSGSLKQKLHGHTATIGSWIQLGHVGVAEIMALAGFDWLVRFRTLRHFDRNRSRSYKGYRQLRCCAARTPDIK